MSTPLREGCGTYLGLRLHQAAGEQPCSLCLREEAYRRVEAEGIPFRLPRPVPAARGPEVAAAAGGAGGGVSVTTVMRAEQGRNVGLASAYGTTVGALPGGEVRGG